MTRIHYELIKPLYEKAMGRKFTPGELLGINKQNATQAASQAVVAGGEPEENLAYNYQAALIAFAESGRQCFELGPKLTEAFSEVDLSNVKPEHIRMPYEGFWITFPEGTTTFWGGKRTGFHDTFGVYVHRSESNALRVLLYGGPNKYSTDASDDAISWITVDLEDMKRKGTNFEEHLENLLKNYPSYAPWFFDDDGKPVEDGMSQLEAQHDIAENRDSNKIGKDSYIKPGMPSPSVEALRQHMNKSLSLAIRLAVNTILYLISPKKEVEQDEKHFRDAQAVDRLCKDEDQLKPSKVAKLATKVSKKKYTRLSRLAPTLEEELSQRKGRWTMAHWQMYWTGPGRKIPTPVFKVPYFSGEKDPSDDEVRSYDVSEEKRTGS